MSTFSVLTKIACPKCGKPVEQYTPGTQTLICSACGSHIAVGGESPELISGGRKLASPPVPIKIGSTCKIGGVDYFVMGRVVYIGWDEEETDDTWTWNEWLLGGSDGRLLWLSYDENGFTLFRKLRLTQEFDPYSSTAIPAGDGKFARVHERYPAKIHGAEGELTWRAKPEDRLYMVEAAGHGKRYSVQAAAEELEVHEGTPLTETEMAAAFGNQTWLKQIETRKRNSGLLATVGAICLVFSVFALVAGLALGSTGEFILQQTVQLEAVEEASVTLPVEFDQVNRPAIISMNMRGTLPVNTGFDVDFSIKSPNEVETFLFLKDFWHETGYEDGEYWDESSYSASDMFVPTMTGTHQLEITIEDTLPDVSTLTFDIEVRRNHITPMWYVIYAIVVAIIGVGVLFAAFAINQPKTS